MSEQSKHTQEPWVVYGAVNKGRICIDGHHGEGIAVTEPRGYFESNANARRIVVAVNGCKGISTEALEKGVVKELLDVAKDILENTVNPVVGADGRLSCGFCGRYPAHNGQEPCSDDCVGERLKDVIVRAESQ